jgi:pyridoxine 5-phosphate synthase
MAATAEMQEIALALHPDSVTLVPEKREEVTTEGGLDLRGAGGSVGELIDTVKKAGIKACAFLGPDLDQINEAAHQQFDAVEIHTGQYANATPSARAEQLRKIKDAAAAIRHLGMAAHAGHGLTYHNVQPILQISEIEELNIGHSIVARAVFVGLDRAIRDMLRQMGRL